METKVGKKRVVAIAVDQEGFKSTQMFSRFLLKSDDDVHILSVKHYVPGQMVQIPSMMPNGESYGGFVNEVTYQHTKRDEEERVEELLQGVAESPVFNNFHPKVHALDPIGGASGVAESLVDWCKENEAGLLCLGMREQSGFGSILRAILGFGSVSKYSINRVKIPVCIVHGLDKEPNAKKKVAVCMNGSESTRSLHWVCQNVLDAEQVEIHIISVALKAPYDIVTEDSTSSHVLSNQEHDEDDRELHDLAEKSIDESLKIVLGYNVDKDGIIRKVLDPKEGSINVAEAIKQYTEENGIDLVCMGRRNLSPIRRTLDTWLGLGSVSDWCASHLKSSVLIVPDSDE